MTTWKPGDVAMVEYGHGLRDRALRLDPRGWEVPGGHLKDGHTGATFRPLVVIDPESAEDMIRLAEAWDNVTRTDLGDTPMPLRAYRMQAALREFANPTPPRCDDEFRAGGSRGIHCELAHDHTEWHRSDTNEVTWS